MRIFLSLLAIALSFVTEPAFAEVANASHWILRPTPQNHGPVTTLAPLRAYQPRPVAEPDSLYSVENRPEVTSLDQEIRSLSLLDDADFRWQAFQYASSAQGMHWNWGSAKTWADELTKLSRPQRARRLALYRKAYKYATDKDGLDWMPEAARAFADNVATRPDGIPFLILHRKAFTYAYRDPNGLKWDWSPAKTFADRLAARADGFPALALHRHAFQYARKTLQLSWGEAKMYADEKSGIKQAGQ